MLKRIGKQRYVLLPGRIEPEPTGIRDRFRTENFYRKKMRYGLGSVKTVPLPALLVACEEGHLDAVEHIVDVWGADAGAAATFYPRYPVYHYHNYGIPLTATPLFVAALKGHIEVVRYLLSKDVALSVSVTGSYFQNVDGITPLHAALIETRPGQWFYDKDAESNAIVRLLLDAGADPSPLAADGTPAWESFFCRIHSTIALIDRGLNLKQRNKSGETILHHWIKSNGELKISNEGWVVFQLLFEKGADLRAQDDKGFTPIITAAECGSYDILDFLLERPEIERTEKIAAMELAGAQLLLEANPENVEKAYRYWRQALRLREGPDPIEKIPLMTTGRAVEWVNLADLDRVIHDPSVHWIQSMMVRLRTYFYMSCEAVFQFVSIDLQLYRFRLLSHQLSNHLVGKGEEETRMTDVQDLILEILGCYLNYQAYGLPLDYSLRSEAQSLVDRFTESLSFTTLREDDPQLNIELERIKTFLQLVVTMDQTLGWFNVLDYEFLAKLAGVPAVHQQQDIRKYLSQWLHSRRYCTFFLIWACEKEDYNTIRLLLCLGAHPNTATDHLGNQLLHMFADREEDPRVLRGELEREQISKETECTIAHLLFDYGANPCAINNDGKTPVDLWIQKNCGVEGMQSKAWNHRPYWCRSTVPKLSCLAVKTIRTHAVSISKDPEDVPAQVIHFFENH